MNTTLSRLASLTVLLVAASLGASAQPGSPDIEEILAEEAAGGDWYGTSVDISGDMLIVGSQRGGRAGQGYAYVFERSDTGWDETGGLYENGVVAFQGSSVRILPGERPLALVGGAGRSLIWERVDGAWTLSRVFTPLPTGPQSWAVGLARDAAGADYVANAGRDSLYVLRRAPGAADWVVDGCLGDPGRLAATQAALWIAADGVVTVAVKRRDRAEVAVLRRTGGTGAACGGTWTLEGVLTPSVLRPTESFAFDVEADAALRVPRTAATAATPDRVAVAAWESVNGGPDGAAFVYERTPGGEWVEALRVPGPAPADGSFGREVALSGETLAVVSLRTHFYRLDQGGAEAYEFSQVDLVGTAMRPPAFAFSGRTVAIGDYLWDTAAGINSGLVWAFTVPASVVVGAEGAPGEVSAALTAQPNPARGAVTLSADPGVGVVHVEVSDVLGRVVWRGAAEGAGTWRVDVSGWAPGVYVARAASDVFASVATFTVVR